MIVVLSLAPLWALEGHAAVLGQTVTNTASVSYDGEDGNPVTVLTLPADFMVQAKRTESTVEFFRYSPNAPDAIMVQINGSDYSAAGNLDGPFSVLPTPTRVLNTNTGQETNAFDFSRTIPLVEAENYLSGELIFVRVTDAGYNADPNIIETISVLLEATTEDKIVLRLYENTENSGQFWGFVQSVRTPSPVYDTELTTQQGTQLKATYVDHFDNTEVSIDTAVVDPYGRVFNGMTGELIDNAKVTLINTATGQPAVVYGVDGASRFPSSLMSGQDIVDEGGQKYDLHPGEFIFPIVPLGNYTILVEPPEGLGFASILSAENFTNLMNAPFDISGSSYGRDFKHKTTGTINTDIPLDGASQFTLNKVAATTSGDVGDFIGYTITIENRGAAHAPVVVRDTLPRGFKYVVGSSSLGGQTLADPKISPTGSELTYSLGGLRIGDRLELKYVLEIGAGVVRGEAMNSIVAINGQGENTSNIARANITIREDLLRSRSTIIGRISENSCDGDEDWARSIQDGTGVEGVRLYMETGAYAITDPDGLYHFEGVKPGTHVVQVDEETLPEGYTPMVCEESSRYAGSATSKFVDVQGGIWRSNFYLKKTGVSKKEDILTAFNDQTEYKQYDEEWLATQTADVQWVYPSPDRTPSTPSVNIGIKHAPGQKIKLTLNGRAVPKVNFAARDSDAKRRVMLSRWRGVDLLEGKNVFTASVVGKAGKTIQTFTRDIFFVKNIARAVAMPDQSVLVADGRTKPSLAVRLEDEAGRAVHAGRIANVEILAPYRLHESARLEASDELVAPLSAQSNVVTGAGGMANIILEPTLQTGKVTIIVTLDDGRKTRLFMYLEPEKRDWILVGLAEGSAAHNSLKNVTRALSMGAKGDLQTDGRVAFFAKGMVKGNWILTLAVDTDKRRGSRDGDFVSEIDPNAYYTLYGDKSYNEFEAKSRYPVYLKLEKKTFYAMFGDFDTNITEGKLTRYSRHLSGLKSEYLGASFQSIVYAAETNQGFAKDEIAAQGISGPYYLSNAPVLSNSETIVIETRDRVRPDLILKSRRLVRHLDYSLDTLSGEIIFRLPVDVSDSGFNPNVIVVDYETSGDAERNLSYGGRVQKQLMGGKIQLGSTFVHEGGNGQVAGSKSDMIGAEIIAQVSKGTEVRVEYALSSQKSGSADAVRKVANAFLAEVIHTSDKLTAQAYMRQEDGSFGLKQRGSNTNNIRRYGANAAYKFREFENKKTGRRGSDTVNASVYKEENLSTGSTRTLSEASIGRDGDILNASVGVRQVDDRIVGALDRKSMLALASVQYNLPKHGASFQISHEQPLGGNDAASGFPQRTRLSIDKTLTKKANVHIAHDILKGANVNGQNTAIGVTFSPWTSTEITAGSDMITSDSGRRIGATIALDQQFRIGEKWSGSVGLSNRRILSGTAQIAQLTPDAAVSPLETNESSSAFYAGLGYRTLHTSVSMRGELRTAQTSDTYVASFSAAREMSEILSFAGALRASFRDQDSVASSVISDLDLLTAVGGTALDAIVSGSSTKVDGRLGLAWRPRNENLVVLNRFDVVYSDSALGGNTRKLVNNLAANAQVTDRWQASLNYGVKYVQTQFGGANYSGFTHLAGAETRFDISERIDFGLHGSVLYGASSQTAHYAFGPSLGFSPVDNVWLSLGYNVVGYKDRDFTAAEYSQKGAYMKFRFKFDQDTARSLLGIISENKN